FSVYHQRAQLLNHFVSARRTRYKPRIINDRPGDLIVRQRDCKVDPIEKHTGVHPTRGLFAISGRKLVLIKRLTHSTQPLVKRRCSVRIAIQPTDSRGRQLQWRFDLHSKILRRVELRRVQDRANNFANVSVRLQEDLRGTVYERRGRIIGNKPLANLLRHKTRGGGMPSQNIEYRQAVAYATARRNRSPENYLGSLIVHPRAKDKSTVLIRAVDSPTCEAARHLLDVLLSVSSVDSERVQLHQLSSIVLIDVSLARLRLCDRGRRIWVLCRSCCLLRWLR